MTSRRSITFVIAAYNEEAALPLMHERLAKILGKQKQKPQISTFHSHCVRVLRRHARVLGYPERFAIYDRGDQESLARTVLRDIKVPSESLRPGDLLFYIGQWKTRGVRPAESARIARDDKEHLASMG